MSPVISAPRIAYWIPTNLRTSFVYVDGPPVKNCSVQRSDSALGFVRLRHLHEGDAAGFPGIPVLDHGDGFDTSVGGKNFPQLLFRHRDVQVSDKNVSHEFLV